MLHNWIKSHRSLRLVYNKDFKSAQMPYIQSSSSRCTYTVLWGNEEHLTENLNLLFNICTEGERYIDTIPFIGIGHFQELLVREFIFFMMGVLITLKNGIMYDCGSIDYQQPLHICIFLLKKTDQQFSNLDFSLIYIYNQSN